MWINVPFSWMNNKLSKYLWISHEMNFSLNKFMRTFLNHHLTNLLGNLIAKIKIKAISLFRIKLSNVDTISLEDVTQKIH